MGIAFSHDLNGNTTAIYGNVITWDAENRMIGYKKGSVQWNWEYDGMNRRVKERRNGEVTRQWVWAGLELVEEWVAYDGNLTAQKRRFYPEGERRTGSTGSSDAGNYYYTRDHLGSIREVFTATQSSGLPTVKARYDYDPYGRRTRLGGAPGFDTDRGYTGHPLHPATGLYMAPFRSYDPELGRWLSRDPIAEDGGINLYGYVGNGPLRYVDPLGLTIGTPASTDTPSRAFWDAIARGAYDEAIGVLNTTVETGYCTAQRAKTLTDAIKQLQSLNKWRKQWSRKKKSLTEIREQVKTLEKTLEDHLKVRGGDRTPECERIQGQIQWLKEIAK